MAMLPVIPQAANNWLLSPTAQAALGSFPPNLIQYLSEDTQKAIMLYICQHYAWPQIMERVPFEAMWRNILQMYRIKLDAIYANIEQDSPSGKDLDEQSSCNEMRVADSVFFDAVERLTNIHHFVSFKEGMPIQFNIPKYYDTRSQDAFYHPFRDLIQAANSLLQWNFDNEDIFRKHAVITRHFYTYGVSFARSEFSFVVAPMQRMLNTGQPMMVPEITEIGTTFDPLSIRKLWLNYRLNAYDMDYQPCPFLVEETPRFATLQNQYHPQINPFGFLNLDKVQAAPAQYMFSEPELASVRDAMQRIITGEPYSKYSVPDILDPKYSVESLWTFYPMLPLDPQTGEWMVRKDGSPVPHFRYLVNTFGSNLAGGGQIMLRIQRNFYPRDRIPLYGTSHMPDLDSGLYTPSLGYLLWNHYKEIITCKQQFLTNKDWINNPPAWVLASSPAVNQNLTRQGAKVEVNSPNDFGWRPPYDATQSTVNMMQHLRDQAQTSTKSEDSLLGKAMGGRTSASEAQNVFQASMSAVTTPINIFNYDIMGGFATRVWEYTGTWFPPDLLKAITGQMGFVLTPEDLWLRVGLKWDIGSTYIESIVRQQNIRYMLESSMGDPTINRAPMWRELLEEWRFDTAGEWVNDGGFEKEVYLATNQAINTFYGKQVIVNPDQNHQIAIKVKTRFLEDQESVFMTQYRNMAPALVQQIQQHQNFLMAQMHLQMLQANMGIQRGAMDMSQGGPPPQAGRQPPLQGPAPPPTPGAMMQTGGPSIGT